MTLKLIKISELQPLDFPREESQRKIQAWGINEIPKIFCDGKRKIVVNGNNGIFYLNERGYKFILADIKQNIPDYHLNEIKLVANHFQRQGISSFNDLTYEKIKKFKW